MSNFSSRPAGFQSRGAQLPVASGAGFLMTFVGRLVRPCAGAIPTVPRYCRPAAKEAPRPIRPRAREGKWEHCSPSGNGGRHRRLPTWRASEGAGWSRHRLFLAKKYRTFPASEAIYPGQPSNAQWPDQAVVSAGLPGVSIVCERGSGLHPQTTRPRRDRVRLRGGDRVGL